MHVLVVVGIERTEFVHCEKRTCFADVFDGRSAYRIIQVLTKFRAVLCQDDIDLSVILGNKEAPVNSVDQQTNCSTTSAQ